jgi:hypothetical protein
MPQLSLNVGNGIEYKLLGALHSESVEGELAVGFSASLTVTVCTQVIVWVPRLAVHVTFVVPTGNCDGALLVTVITPHPVTAGVPRFTPVAKQAPGFDGTLVILAGHANVNGMFGIIVTVVVVEFEQKRPENT